MRFNQEYLSFVQQIEQLTSENTQLKIENAKLKATAAGKDQLIAELRARVEFAEKISLQRLPGETVSRPSL